MNTKILKYKIIYYIRYSADAFFYPFIFLYLSSLGYTNKDLGWILMLLPLVGVFINPIWLLFSKNVNQNKKFLIIFSVCEGLLIILLTHLNFSIYWIFLIMFSISIFSRPYYILMDGYSVEFCSQIKYEYTKLRIFGSIAYAITTISAGFIINYLGYVIPFHISAILFIITGIVFLSVDKLNIDEENLVNVQPNYRELFTNKSFWKFLILCVFWSSVQFASDTYLPGYFTDIYNVSNSTYGIIIFGYFLTEVVLMFIFSMLSHKLNTRIIITIGILSNFIRYLVYYMQPSLINVIIFTQLRGLSLACYLFMFFKILRQKVHAKNITLANIVISSVMSLVNVLITVIGGYVTNDKNYYQYFFLASATLTIVALIFMPKEIKEN